MVAVFNQIAPCRLPFRSYPGDLAHKLSSAERRSSDKSLSIIKLQGSENLGLNNLDSFLAMAELDLVGDVVSSIFQVSRKELFDHRRGKAPVAFARQVAMYLLHIVCGRSFTDVGVKFGRDRTTVSHACQLIEDTREDPDVDWALDLMEHSVSSIAALFVRDNI